MGGICIFKELVFYFFEKINLLGNALFCRGGFDWHLSFFWEWLPARDRMRRTRDPTSSFKTPAIAGGLFAIDREWFLHLGAYDEELEVRENCNLYDF